MQQDLFMETIKLICKMASIDLIKSVVDSGYMEELYNSAQYESINTSIDKISSNLKQEIFG